MTATVKTLDEETYQRAERARARRHVGGITFSSVPRALSWYYERHEAMSSAPSPFQHTLQRAELGRQVEGGRGGDIDETLSTLVTLGEALTALERELPMHHKLVVQRYQLGMSQANIAKGMGASQGTVSSWLGTAEAWLAGWLRRGGVLS